MASERPSALPTVVAATGLACVVLVAGCGDRRAVDGGDDARWGYSGSNGPMRWAELDPGYSMCAAGEEQSPIDVREPVDQAPSQLAVHLGRADAALFFDGRALDLDVGPGHFIELGSTRYELERIRLHSPSEHRIEGESFPAELQLLLRSSDGWRSALAVMFREGSENRALAGFWEYLPLPAPERPGEDRVRVSGGLLSLWELLPSRRIYYLYPGSLTTPPCSQAVWWIVFADALEMSREQISRLRDTTSGSNRPEQPRNERKVELGVAG